MADFLHEIPEAIELFATIASEMNVGEAMETLLFRKEPRFGDGAERFRESFSRL